MIDVAREAGVSAMTVSNVINGRPGVSAETRLRVLATITRLGYQVNLAARHLRAGRTGAVGLIVPDIDRPYYAQLAGRLAKGVEKRGLHLVVERTGGDAERELEAISFGRLRMYDGVVISPLRVDAADLDQLRFETPVVFIGERPVPATFDHVMMDNVGGARQATRQLLTTGSRRVAVIGGRHDDHVDDMPSLRTRGYRQAHAELGIEVDERLVIEVESFDPASGARGLKRLHESGVAYDGVFALTDAAAMGVLRALADLRVDVPGEVQVIGFDNGEETEFLVPRLSSVEPGNDAMADRVLELLEHRIAAAGDGGTDAPDPATTIVNAQLILRESTR
ncbi:LacI family DNA-binding transcriptional regulator [Jiangella mangrovi]|uniref:DNA-binding LacI/PurR family transcriptional regulator n=1 Tax=Jiangella mangrovi TaxID=1524084 RepID=A0A7W9GW12_9ACTN|nr:LacI family DNA-binding transcriptional regulator [Jiangella mangrovi]MBB5791100.1 DNA-binding LacI/PurR family transcriptional regulator [Jiangella mangrovi]